MGKTLGSETSVGLGTRSAGLSTFWDPFPPVCHLSLITHLEADGITPSKCQMGKLAGLGTSVPQRCTLNMWPRPLHGPILPGSQDQDTKQRGLMAALLRSSGFLSSTLAWPVGNFFPS